MARDDYRTSIQDDRRVRHVFLKGRGFTNDGDSLDGVDYYRSSDPRVIRKFVRYARSRDEWRFYDAEPPDHVVFVL